MSQRRFSFEVELCVVKVGNCWNMHVASTMPSGMLVWLKLGVQHRELMINPDSLYEILRNGFSIEVVLFGSVGTSRRRIHISNPPSLLTKHVFSYSGIW